MKKKRLLEWQEGTSNSKIVMGNKLFFAYKKMNGYYSLAIKEDTMGIHLRCKTKRDCLIISNILNKV